MVRNTVFHYFSGFNLFLVAECPSGFTAWNNNCYKVVLNEGVSWAIAYGRCLNMGARLLVVETKAKWHSLVPILSQGISNQGISIIIDVLIQI